MRQILIITINEFKLRIQKTDMKQKKYKKSGQQLCLASFFKLNLKFFDLFPGSTAKFSLWQSQTKVSNLIVSAKFLFITQQYLTFISVMLSMDLDIYSLNLSQEQRKQIFGSQERSQQNAHTNFEETTKLLDGLIWNGLGQLTPQPNQIPSQKFLIQTINKCNSFREQQLTKEIENLREENKMLGEHYTNLSQSYKQKRDEANKYFLMSREVKEMYEQLEIKYEKLQKKYDSLHEQLESKWAQKHKRIGEIYKRQENEGNKRIRELENSNSELVQLLENSEKQYQCIKSLLEVEKNKRKQTQQKYRKQVGECSMQRGMLKQQVLNVRKQLQKKNSLLFEQEQIISSLRRNIKEITNKLAQLELKAQKQIIRQKSIARKAIDGLQITKKYSELELSKSRKKEKNLIQNQKILIDKVKQICKQQSFVDLSTTAKSSRKGSIKSLNTTINLNKQNNNNSPFVSNFLIDDDFQNLSPIHQISENRQIEPGANQKRKITLKDGKLKIQIPKQDKLENQAAGTPCFETERFYLKQRGFHLNQ